MVRRDGPTYGITARSAVADLGVAIPSFRVPIGETPRQFIDSVAPWARFMVNEDETGVLVLNRVGTTPHASGCTLPGNIETIRAEQLVDRRCPDCLVVWFGVGQLADLGSLLIGSADDRGDLTADGASPVDTFIDLRTTGLLRLGVSTEAARGKSQAQGRRLSQAVYEQTDADGLIYLSRVTGQTCVCIYERALPGPLVATEVVDAMRLNRFVSALRHLNVVLIASR